MTTYCVSWISTVTQSIAICNLAMVIWYGSYTGAGTGIILQYIAIQYHCYLQCIELKLNIAMDLHVQLVHTLTLLSYITNLPKVSECSVCSYPQHVVIVINPKESSHVSSSILNSR